MANGCKQALRDSIYRPKDRRTWTRSTDEISLTKNTVKGQDSIMDDSGERKTVLEDEHIRKDIPSQYNP